jgi:hypothetical protein
VERPRGPLSGALRETGALQAGGALREAALYVERPADRELSEALLGGEACAVVAPRQMGKSSLRRRAGRALMARGARCLDVDLGLVGAAGAGEEAWFHAVALLLAGSAGGALDRIAPPARLARLRSPRARTPGERFARFVREELCPPTGPATVVLIDEIDVALGLPSPTEDLIAAIAEIARPGSEEAAPLGVGLFGVTLPEGWAQARGLQPAARVIALEAFTAKEAAAFLPALAAAGGSPEGLLEAILDVTHGHPHRTHRLVELLARGKDDDDSSAGGGGEADKARGAAPRERIARLVQGELEADPTWLTPLAARGRVPSPR